MANWLLFAGWCVGFGMGTLFGAWFAGWLIFRK